MNRVSLDGIPAVLGATSVLVAYLWLVGSAVRVVASRWTLLPRSAGVSVALGAATSVVVVALCYRAGADVEGPVLPLGVLAAAAVLVVGVLGVRRRRAGAPTGLGHLLPVGGDAVALVAALVLVAPLLRHGLTYWTTFANDFPNYAASAQVWTGGDEAFLEQHPDAFGQFQARRASFEKPMVTALLVVGTRVTGTEPYALLAPVMLVSLFVLVATVLVLATRTFGGRLPVLASAVLVPTVSIVPMSRVYDAQIGQTVAVMLVAALLAVAVGARPAPGRAGIAAVALVVAVVATACLGSNPTLVLATAPSWVALGAWLLVVSGEWRPRLPALLWAVLGAVVLSVPLAPLYLRSLRAQTIGELGFDIPLAMPASLVGLQSSLDSAPATGQTLLLWLGLAVALAAGYTIRRRSSPGHPAVAVLVLVLAANGVYVGVAQGADGYALHKWLAVVVAVVVPLLLARAATLAPPPARAVVTVALGTVAAVGTSIALHAAATVTHVVPASLLALADDDRVTDAGVLNIELGDVYENSVGALVARTDRVVVTGPTYAAGALPQGSTFLVRQDLAGPGDLEELDGPYALLDVDLTVGLDPVVFDAAHPHNQRYLFGSWLPPEVTGTWTSSRRTWIVLDVDPELRDHDLDLLLEGARFADPSAPRRVTIRVNGERLDSALFATPFTPRTLRVRVPAELAAADGGRLTITLQNPDPLSPATFAEPDAPPGDERELAFWLSTLTLQPISTEEPTPVG